EFLGHAPPDVRAFGISGLLHDVGKVRIPRDILNKPGKLSPEERRIINQHPADGARLLLASPERLEMAAIVAYEHHMMHDGGGYPTPRYCRTCHSASRLAHVCDVYDALRTHRPYRGAWTSEAVLAYLEERAGTEFDPDVAHAFVRMMRQWEPRFTTRTSPSSPPRPPRHRRTALPFPRRTRRRRRRSSARGPLDIPRRHPD